MLPEHGVTRGPESRGHHGGGPIQVLLLAREGGAVLQARDEACDAALAENGMGEPGLRAVAQPGEEHQEEADADQQQRLLQRLGSGAFHQDQPKGRFDHEPGEHRGQQRVGQKTHKGVEQNEAVILQENEEGQRYAGMVDDQFARPGLIRVARSEMQKGHREQSQAHGGRDANSSGAPGRAAEDGAGHRGRRQDQEPDCDQQQRRLMERGTAVEDFREMHDYGNRAQQVAGPHHHRPALF